MSEVGGQLVAGEGRHVVADDDALGERLVHRHGEPAAQFGLAEREQAEAVLGVVLIVGQEAWSSRTSGRRRCASSTTRTERIRASVQRRETSPLIWRWRAARERSTLRPMTLPDDSETWTTR